MKWMTMMINNLEIASKEVSLKNGIALTIDVEWNLSPRVIQTTLNNTVLSVNLRKIEVAFTKKEV